MNLLWMIIVSVVLGLLTGVVSDASLSTDYRNNETMVLAMK